MAIELSREVDLGAGTITVVLQDEFGCISKHTVDITATNGQTVDQVSAFFQQERKDRVTAMLPYLETLSDDHAELVTKIMQERNAG